MALSLMKAACATIEELVRLVGEQPHVPSANYIFALSAGYDTTKTKGFLAIHPDNGFRELYLLC
jgi:hypothetical protein